MLNISIEKRGEGFLVTVSDDETGSSTTLYEENFIDSIQAALDWGMRDVSVSYVHTAGDDFLENL